MMDRDLRHDLNNLLSSIATYADLLSHDLDAKSTQHKYVQAMAKSASAAMEMINSPAQRNAEALAPSLSTPTQGQQRLVMVVDDQPDMRETMKLVLEMHGYRVDTCDSAEALLAILGTGNVPYDLVVMDHSMPGKSGIEAAREIDQDHSGLPVILVTGYDRDSLSDETDQIDSIASVLDKSAIMTTLPAAVAQALF